MTDKKIPEINLEVSCGGTFRVSTDELACRITVLLPEGAASTSLPMAAPAPLPAPAPPPEPAAPIIERVVDPFYAEAVHSCIEEVDAVAESACDALGCSTSASGSARIGAVRASLLDATDKAAEGTAELSAALNRIQAQIVDLRFALTFLKNHAALKPRPAGSEQDVTIKAGDHARITAKIAESFKNAQGINDQLASVKKAAGSLEAPSAGKSGTLLKLLGKVQGDLLAAVFSLSSMFEQKTTEGDNISVEQARKNAHESLAGFAAARGKSALAAEEPTPDQIEELMRSIPGEAPATVASIPASGEPGIMDLGEEMSDEEALRKLQEFGL